MKKSNQFLFLVFALMATLSFGCVLASAAVPPTNTPAPPTNTPVPPMPPITPYPTETVGNTPAPTLPPTMLPLQVSNFYGIPHDSPEWLTIPRGRYDNKTAFNILVLGTDMNCTLTINTKTDFTGLSDQKKAIVLGSHTWNILKTYRGDRQIDEIYYPDIYPQEFREGGGIDGNGYLVTGFYDGCRLSIQEILSRVP